YEQYRRAMLAHDGNATDPGITLRTVKACLLRPLEGESWDAINSLVDLSINQENELKEFTKGLAEYRQGRFGSAVEWMKKALAAPAVEYGVRRDAQGYLVLAMAYHQLGQVEQARAALDKGREFTETMLPKFDSMSEWQDYVIALIFLREA